MEEEKMHNTELYKVDSIRYMYSSDNKYTMYIFLCYTLPMWSISQITFNTSQITFKMFNWLLDFLKSCEISVIHNMSVS